MMRLCWMPTWSCQNYAKNGGGYNHNCPYCPLGLRDGRLSFYGISGSKNGSVDPEKMIDFLLRHESVFSKQITISGGEPLASPALVPVLTGIARHGYSWGITSNTLLRKPLSYLSASLSGFNSCQAWTASYHPLSTSPDVFEDNIRFLRLNGARWVYANVVACHETSALLHRVVRWLLQLPIDRVNVLVDMYRGQDNNFLEIAAISSSRVLLVGTGRTVTGVHCHTRSRFLVVSPTGTIYQCVKKCYEELDPIGNIADSLIILNDLTEWCSLDCSHTCDQVKHSRKQMCKKR